MFTRPLAIAAFLLCGPLYAQPAALPPLDMVPEADLKPTIEWKEDWQKSLQWNRERWEKELASELDRELRDRRFEARQAALLLAAREKWPEARADPRLTLALADRLGQMGAPVHRVEELKALIESRPGDFETSLAALQKILHTNSWSALSLPPGTMEYAIDRLATLERGGFLPPGDPAVGKGYLVLAELRRLQGRTAEAMEAARQAEARLERKAPLLWTLARLSADLGLRDEARSTYEELHRVAGDTREAERAHAEMTQMLEQLSVPGPLPTVRGDSTLVGRWEMVRDAQGPPERGAITRLLDDPDAIYTAVQTGGSRYRSLWSALVLLLEERYPAMVEEFAATSAAPAEEAVSLASTDADLLAAHRRFPWAEPVHRAMLAAGERALWRGEYGGALRWFDDLLARARTPELREQAAVGRWLAMSQAGDAAALDAALAAGLNASEQYPWRGGTIAGRELAEQLRKSAAAASGGPGPQLPRDVGVLALPPVEIWAPVMIGGTREQRRAANSVAPWPTIDAEGRAFVAGPAFVAGFDNAGQPTWSRANHVFDGIPSSSEGQLIPPTPLRPSVAQGVVITRGAPAAETGAPTALIAFDAGSGTPRWSSQGLPGWEGLIPVSDVAFADGWGYVLAMNDGVLATAHVVSLDPATGAVRWRRALAAQAPSIQSGGGRALNLARYGSPPTVAGGALYVSTNLGIVAKLDVRDGAIDWMTLYTRTSVNREGLPLIRSVGSSPIIAGTRIIIAARDRGGVFALDAATGAHAWENPTAPLNGVAGFTQGRVVVFGERVMAGIDPSTGEIAWWRGSEEVFKTPPMVLGDAVGFLDGSTLHRLDAATGLDVDERDWGSVDATTFAVGPERIATVSTDAAGTATGGESMVRDAGVSHLSRTAPVVLVPPTGAERIVLIRSTELLEAVEVSAEPRVRWRRRLRDRDAPLVWLRDGFLIVEGDGVEFVRVRDGVTQWRADLGWPITHVAVDDAGVAVASFPEDAHGAPQLAMLEPTDGSVRWRRPIIEQGRRIRLKALGFHDGMLHASGGDDDLRKPPRRIVFEPREGRPQSGVALGEGTSRGIKAYGFLGGVAWVLRDSGDLQFTDLDGKTTATKLPGFVNRNDTGTWPSRDERALAVVQRVYDWRIRKVRETVWLTPRESPANTIGLTNSGFAMHGDKIAAIAGEEVGLYTVGGTDRTTTFDVAQGEGKVQPLAAAFDPKGERVAVLSETTIDPSMAYPRERLRIDVFDARGSRLASLPIPAAVGNALALAESAGRPIAEGRIAWIGESLVVGSRDAVHFLPVPTSTADAPGEIAIPYREEPIALDGDLADWAGVASLPLVGVAGYGTLQWAHDGKRLFLAVSHPQDGPAPLLAPGPAGAGSWLELGVAPHRWADWRIGLALGAAGEPLWLALDEDGVPADVSAAVRFDPAARELRYELSIPIEHVARGQRNGWLESGLSVAAWRSGDGADSLQRLEGGGGLERPTLYMPALQTVRLSPVPKKP